MLGFRKALRGSLSVLPLMLLRRIGRVASIPPGTRARYKYVAYAPRTLRR
jgi:hypothetical protein